MADDVLSEVEAEHIITIPKRITEQNRWQERDGNYIMELPVEAEEQLPLRLYGRFNPRKGNYSFILFYGKFRIRAMDVGKRHHNPECDNVGSVHIHKWSDRNRDKWAYEPDVVEGELTIKGIFNKMLEECNITHQEVFISPPGGHQRGF